MKTPFRTSFPVALFSLLAAAPSFAETGVTLEGCKTDIRAEVVKVLRADPTVPDEPANLYIAQQAVTQECFARAIEAGLFTRDRAGSIEASIDAAADRVCGLKRENGSMPTTGEQNQCRLDLLSLTFRML